MFPTIVDFPSSARETQTPPLAAAAEPGLTESLHRAGRWCQSTMCPMRKAAAESRKAGEPEFVPLIRLGQWCESTTCPLV